MLRELWGPLSLHSLVCAPSDGTSPVPLVPRCAAAVYTGVKQYACCTALDTVGGVWTGMIIAGCCAFVQCGLAVALIALLDRLPSPG